MSEAGKQLHEKAAYSRGGDGETEAEYLKVRELLSSLPKETCPAGFEYRLNRRLQGGSSRRTESVRGWTSGWLGVGLGFAVATVIALFTLNFHGTENGALMPVQQTAQKVVPVVTPDDNAAKTESPATDPATQDQKLMANTDSVKRDGTPTYVSPDRLQQVSGDGNAQGHR